MGTANVPFRSRLEQNKRLAGSLVLVLMVVLLSFLLITGGVENTGIFWFSTFPLLAFFLRGKKEGLLWIFILILVESIILLLNHWHYLSIPYSSETLAQGFFSFFIVTILAFSYEYIRELQANQLKKVAAVDSLTKAYNRSKITETLEHEIEMAKRYKIDLSLIMLDLDHFKDINDSYGHLVGDFVLQKIAEVIRASIRKTDHFGRWGGEEFVIILPQTKLTGTKVLAQRIASSIENYEFDEVGKVTASFGLTEFKQGDDIDKLIKRVDDALYKAKNSGRNQIVEM